MRVILVLSALLAGLTGCTKTPHKGPDRYRVQFETSKGNFVVDVVRGWSPIGSDHFHELVINNYYTENRFFRVIPGFMAQWGISGDPEMNKKWKVEIEDDPPGVSNTVSNTAGTITFAKTSAPNSRSTQLFINFGDNSRLDATGFTPFGRVTEGMNVVMSINAEYAERPSQERMTNEGNSYLKAEFPNLDYIKKATIIP
jgi:peptidyl-prolyl cis-trans isomerase A (cyclophilin A)